jgi:hypothetical protein
MSIEKDLDQFYTKEEVSMKCLMTLDEVLKGYYDYNDVTFLEPSAGAGSFIRSLKDNRNLSSGDLVAVDLMPRSKEIIQMDFLETTRKNLSLPKKNNVITIGNPPFGKRSKLSVEFFNHAASLSDTIAFIIPVQWNKWSVQSKVNKDFRLIHSEQLQEDAFIFKGKSYKVRCVFQIWTRKETHHQNLRLTEAPKLTHEDFEIYQYNNTPQAEKFFYENWDFAVPRQGYYDYSIRETDESKMNRKIQWIFFKAKNKRVLNRLLKMNFCELAKKNTTVLGFGKADVIEAYDTLMSEKEMLVSA